MDPHSHPVAIQFTSQAEGKSLTTLLAGDSGFSGWEAFCTSEGYSSAQCESAAVLIASSRKNNVRG